MCSAFHVLRDKYIQRNLKYFCKLAEMLHRNWLFVVFPELDDVLSAAAFIAEQLAKASLCKIVPDP